MASERQVAANRTNAKRSTGPQTEEGKRRSSRNALSHGLARPAGRPDAEIHDLAVSIAGVLGRQDAIYDARDGALALARAKLRLAEVGRIRSAMLTSLLEALFDPNIRAICSLDRYERAAFTKYRRAIRLLSTKPV